MVSAKVCPWCDGSGNWTRREPLRGDERPDDVIECQHPGPVDVHVLPGATFRVTKFESVGGGERSRQARETWKAPADVGKAFRKACARPVPQFEDVT